MASELCDILDTEFGAPDPEDPHSLNEARERVWSLLGLVHDVERRASLAMAYLNLRPSVKTCDRLALCLAFVVYQSLLAVYMYCLEQCPRGPGTHSSHAVGWAGNAVRCQCASDARSTFRTMAKGWPSTLAGSPAKSSSRT